MANNTQEFLKCISEKHVLWWRLRHWRTEFS
jgi:hypothetical protein